MEPLLIATTNDAKLREIREILRGVDRCILSLSDFPPVPEPDETESSFSANALLKARAYAKATGLVTVAEDSGLVIDAIGGAPGVHSARYPGATYPEKFANLYATLAKHPRPWTCRYVCAVAVVGTDSLSAEARRAKAETGGNEMGRVQFETLATVEGEIWPHASGTNGFGYDPIFFYPPYGLTFGEVSDTQKLAVAHRGQAFLDLRRWLDRGEYPAALR
ncbi:MAG: non-canonical purine NTP pyrophosphatase [Vicinamibacterales bacterium]